MCTMSNIMDSVSNILGIDKVNMDGKLILIEEQHNSNADFLLSSVIFNALKKNYGICFVLFHNAFNHYHNMGMKFGYNLTLLKEKGKITIVEPMKIVASNVECMYEQTTNDVIHDIYVIIKNESDKMIKNSEPVIIVIDDISHFYNFKCDLRESMYYVRCLRSLIEHYDMLQLCIVIHTYKHELKNCIPNIFAYGLKHMAQLYTRIEPLETGHSSDVSGSIIINWRIDSIRTKYNWPEIVRYMFKLSDRQIHIYAPGTLVSLT